jgi:hypothetical protein
MHRHVNESPIGMPQKRVRTGLPDQFKACSLQSSRQSASADLW